VRRSSPPRLRPRATSIVNRRLGMTAMPAFVAGSGGGDGLCGETVGVDCVTRRSRSAAASRARQRNALEPAIEAASRQPPPPE
jgi:hypothetical protein